jgi:hypothetical protein
MNQLRRAACGVKAYNGERIAPHMRERLNRLFRQVPSDVSAADLACCRPSHRDYPL